MKQPFNALAHPPKMLGQDSSIPFVEFEHYRFHYRIFGEQHRESILVLHGGPGGDLHYLLPLQTLATKYRLIFFDQRGTGFSPRVDAANLSLEQYLKDVNAFVEHFSQNGSLHIIGHSWGAYLALQYARRYPAKVRSLILAAPFIPGIRTNVSFILHNLRHGIIPKLINAKLKSLGAPLTDPQAQLDYFFGLLLRNANPGYRCPGKDTAVPIGRAGYLAYRKLSSDRNGAKELQDIAYPPEKMLILAGACDQLLGMKFQKRVSKKLGYPEMVEIPEAGHYLFQDNPEACFQHIRTFLQKASS